MVAWSILADDLEAELLDGGAPAKPASTAWSWWSQALSKRVEPAAAALPYWAGAARAAADAAALPVDDPARDNIQGGVVEHRLVLDQALASRFLKGMSSEIGRAQV